MPLNNVFWSLFHNFFSPYSFFILSRLTRNDLTTTTTGPLTNLTYIPSRKIVIYRFKPSNRFWTIESPFQFKNEISFSPKGLWRGVRKNKAPPYDHCVTSRGFPHPFRSFSTAAACLPLSTSTKTQNLRAWMPFAWQTERECLREGERVYERVRESVENAKYWQFTHDKVSRVKRRGNSNSSAHYTAQKIMQEEIIII